jgi:hypothetical protein
LSTDRTHLFQVFQSVVCSSLAQREDLKIIISMWSAAAAAVLPTGLQLSSIQNTNIINHWIISGSIFRSVKLSAESFLIIIINYSHIRSFSFNLFFCKINAVNPKLLYN